MLAGPYWKLCSRKRIWLVASLPPTFRKGDLRHQQRSDALLIQTGQKRPSVEKELPRDEAGEYIYDDEDEMVYQPMLEKFPEGLNPNLFVEPEDGPEKLFEKVSCARFFLGLLSCRY